MLTNYSQGSTGFSAGLGWAAGSKIIIILNNGFDGQANGGEGGDGERIFFDFPEPSSAVWRSSSPSSTGSSGGVVYDAMGVTTDIYFSGATPSAAYPVADGYIRAPGGGGAGTDSPSVGNTSGTGYGGNSGGGGAGRSAGTAGLFGLAVDTTFDNGVSGGQALDGTIAGVGGTTNNISQSPAAENGGNWGQSTATNLAGAGVVDSGATVTFFGSTAARYINGTGDH